MTIERAVNVVCKAENILNNYVKLRQQKVRVSEEFINQMERIYKEMQECIDIEVSDSFADKFSFFYRRIHNTLYLEHRVCNLI